MTAVEAERHASHEALPDDAPPAPPQASFGERTLRIAIPVGMLMIVVVAWQLYVTLAEVPHYILPSPLRIAEALSTDWEILGRALLITLRTTFFALILALVGGVLLSILLVQSRWVELAFFPYAVIMQVTPIVAIAPLILIYTQTTQQALLICAWIVAFFPVLSNTTQGLR
ncbi:MAG TPA: ABC transporter permease, partial [Bauldia sp.]|nr:ABC transporter permease [Bauldia sp.]